MLNGIIARNFVGWTVIACMHFFAFTQRREKIHKSPIKQVISRASDIEVGERSSHETTSKHRYFLEGDTIEIDFTLDLSALVQDLRDLSLQLSGFLTEPAESKIRLPIRQRPKPDRGWTRRRAGPWEY